MCQGLASRGIDSLEGLSALCIDEGTINECLGDDMRLGDTRFPIHRAQHSMSGPVVANMRSPACFAFFLCRVM